MRRAKRNLAAVRKHQMVGLQSWTHLGGEQQGARDKCQHGKLHVGTREHFFTTRVVKPWNRATERFRNLLPGGTQMCLETALSDPLLGALH